MSPGVTQAPPRSCSSYGAESGAGGRSDSGPTHSIRPRWVTMAPFSITRIVSSHVASFVLRHNCIFSVIGSVRGSTEKGQLQALLARAVDRDLVSGIGVTHHT